MKVINVLNKNQRAEQSMTRLIIVTLMTLATLLLANCSSSSSSSYSRRPCGGCMCSADGRIVQCN